MFQIFLKLFIEKQKKKTCWISFPLIDIEDMLIKTNSKTTKEVKETIKTVLKIKTLKLSPTVKSHLEFVLSMDTID